MFRFEKTGPVRFISHLDLLRAMQRALLRSGLPVEWSRGYHPHPQFAFAMALPVGAESTGEYMEAALAEYDATTAARLGAALGPGLAIRGSGVLPSGAPSLMAAVAASDWMIEPPDGLTPGTVDRLLAKTSAEVLKAGKGGTRTVDIRPGILSLEWTVVGGSGFLRARLAAGSAGNVSPGMLLSALAPGADVRSLRVRRLELYFRGERGLRPLFDMVSGECP